MPIAHAILVSISCFSTVCSCIDDGEVADVALVVDFQIYTDPEVNAGPGTEHIQVRDSTFDDFGQDVAVALVCGNPYSRFMARVQVLSDDWGEFGGGNFVESIAFFFVGVGKRDSSRVAVGHGRFHRFVEEVVHDTMLSLRK